jgi:hypothetical protein
MNSMPGSCGLRTTQKRIEPARSRHFPGTDLKGVRRLVVKCGARRTNQWLIGAKLPTPSVRGDRCPAQRRGRQSEVNDRIDGQHQLVLLSAVQGIGRIVKCLGAVGLFEKQFRANGDRVADPVCPADEIL